ncbi:exopolyphosphatase, partial [Planctomycetota bacterium]|nr:exopolyphosphatase [Planctomycetota bacterium]
HGARCRTLAEGLFDQVSAALGLTPADRLLLGWAAQLHDVGLAVAHSAYHRHGAYLVEHADLAGFSTRDRQEIAALIRGQRRRPRLGSLDDLPRDRARTVLRLLPLLRMALRMRRDRSDRPIPTPTLVAEEGRFTLLFSPGWLEGNPLTRADLDRERRHLASLDLTLELTEST